MLISVDGAYFGKLSGGILRRASGTMGMNCCIGKKPKFIPIDGSSVTASGMTDGIIVVGTVVLCISLAFT